MKTINLLKPVNLDLLTEELFEAFPAWVYQSPTGKATDVIIAADALTVPDADVSAVQEVIDAHNKNKDSKNAKKAKEKAQRKASARAKLIELGLTEEELDALWN